MAGNLTATTGESGSCEIDLLIQALYFDRPPHSGTMFLADLLAKAPYCLAISSFRHLVFARSPHWHTIFLGVLLTQTPYFWGEKSSVPHSNTILLPAL